MLCHFSQTQNATADHLVMAAFRRLVELPVVGSCHFPSQFYEDGLHGAVAVPVAESRKVPGIHLPYQHLRRLHCMEGAFKIENIEEADLHP